ncbi:MAG: BolA family transcriptional regulator [Bdellovibrionales bacterium]|nr:BolA family transcriptional regulator [Bdellovibrionales bacterium]
MTIESTIKEKLKQAYEPVFLSVVNESSNHHVPPGSETHFQVIVVSDAFEGKSRVQRQRLVYQLLSEELVNGVHALSQKLWTPEEWEKRQQEQGAASPHCKNGFDL